MVTAIGRFVFAGNMDQSRHRVLPSLSLFLYPVFSLSGFLFSQSTTRHAATSAFSLVRAASVGESVAHLQFCHLCSVIDEKCGKSAILRLSCSSSPLNFYPFYSNKVISSQCECRIVGEREVEGRGGKQFKRDSSKRERFQKREIGKLKMRKLRIISCNNGNKLTSRYHVI